MKSSRPTALKQNDKVRIVATASPVDPLKFKAGIALLETQYHVKWNDQLLSRDGFLAGDDKQRLNELQIALDDLNTFAIFAVRGGWGTSRIIDNINTSIIVDNPKWVIGSSDLTVLLLKLWLDHKIMSIHGPMPAVFHKTSDEDLDMLFRLLRGDPWVAPRELTPLYTGTACGPLLGGNLTMLAHLCGCIPADLTNGSILFLEDIGEAPYRVDRNLTQLKRAGLLASIAGVILGDFTNCKPGLDNVLVEQVLEHHLHDLGIPVARGYPAAHGTRNYPFVHGCNMKLTVSNTVVELAEEIPTL